MLEPIESHISNTECNYKEYESLKPFLLFYNSECGNKFFTEDKLLNMLVYFKIIKNYKSIDDIEDYGEYFENNRDKFVESEKKRQRYYGNGEKIFPYYIENPQYLIATYNRLKRSIQNRTQYIILKDAILCLSPIDTKHFINILLRKYKTTQIEQIISKIENGK